MILLYIHILYNYIYIYYIFMIWKQIANIILKWAQNTQAVLTLIILFDINRLIVHS